MNSPNIIGVCVESKEDYVSIRIRGMGDLYNACWDVLHSMPREYFFDSWDDFPWSGFKTKYEIVLLEIIKIVGIENICFE